MWNIKKEWAESLIGIKEGIPLRYMYVPEVEIVSYSEVAELGEKAGGKFEIIVKQVIRDGKYATVGDPISLGLRGIGRIKDEIGRLLKEWEGKKMGLFNLKKIIVIIFWNISNYDVRFKIIYH